MRELRRGLTALVAVFAITLHALLMTLAPATSAPAAFDPLSVTCLGGHTVSADQNDGAPDPGTQACDHCVLCAATAAPAPAQLVTAITFSTRPAAGMAITRTISSIRDPDLSPEFPRGPPHTV